MPGHAGPFRPGTFEHRARLAGYTPAAPADPFAGEFKLAGFNGPAGAAFTDSHVVAARVGPVTPASVQADNAGRKLGVAARAGAAKNLSAVTVAGRVFRYRPGDPFPAVLPPDFEVREVGTAGA